MQQAIHKARVRNVSPREFEIQIPQDTPRYWMRGDPYSTHLMNVLSLTFPPGERFFMDAVRAFRSQIKDSALLAQVRGFLGQEALHSREHASFNRWLARFGINGEAFDQAVSAHIKRRRAMRTPIDDLAVTCALEHFTAIMAEGWLTEPELRDMASAAMRALWTWHAIEELDHKSVAYDVYCEVGGEYWRRVRWMLRITLGFIIGVSATHIRYMARDGQFKRPAYVARRWWSYWGPRGHFTRLIPSYLRYYLPNFHPWQTDDSELIARFERELLAERSLGQ